MKKLLALLFAISLSVSMFTGCGPASSPGTSSSKVESTASEAQKKPVTITIWNSADATISDTIQKQLDVLAPDVVVKMERKENMAEALKQVGSDSANAPDMYFWAHDKVGVFAEMGILSPITDILSESDLSDLLPMTLKAGTYKGKMYQLPVYYEALMFLYNKDLMKTPPKTTDELLALMKEKTAKNSYVFVEQHSTSYNSAAWIQGYGGHIISDEKKAGLDLPQTIEALAYHKKFVPYMPADGEYNTVTALFTEGKAQSTIGGPWLIPGLKSAGMKLGIAPMPTLPNGSPLKPLSGVQGIHVLKYAAENKKEAAAKVLKVLASPETGIALANAANCAPANSKAYDNADVTKNEMIMALHEMADKVIPMPNVPEMDVMWGVTDSLLASINKNNGDVTAECKKYQKQAEEQISAMK